MPSSTTNAIYRVNKDSLLPTHVKHFKHRRANTLPLEFDPNPYKTQAIPPRSEHVERHWARRWFNYTKENAAVIGLVLTFLGVIVAIVALIK